MGRTTCFLLGAVAVAIGLLASPIRAQDEATLGAVLDRATRYVTEFRRQFVTIVAEEHYVQSVRANFGSVGGNAS